MQTPIKARDNLSERERLWTEAELRQVYGHHPEGLAMRLLERINELEESSARARVLINEHAWKEFGMVKAAREWLARDAYLRGL